MGWENQSLCDYGMGGDMWKFLLELKIASRGYCLDAALDNWTFRCSLSTVLPHLKCFHF